MATELAQFAACGGFGGEPFAFELSASIMAFSVLQQFGGDDTVDGLKPQHFRTLDPSEWVRRCRAVRR
eukprot:52566-Eustigmatos_ZCMA.PRE.2